VVAAGVLRRGEQPEEQGVDRASNGPPIAAPRSDAARNGPSSAAGPWLAPANGLRGQGRLARAGGEVAQVQHSAQGVCGEGQLADVAACYALGGDVGGG
jgi:hypothetical protein